MTRAQFPAFALVALLGACATHPVAQAPTAIPAPSPAPIEFIAFGDTGYRLDYLDPEDVTPPLDEAAFIADQKKRWIKDHRPPGEFTLPPMAQVQTPTGQATVAASGLLPTARAIDNYCAGTARCQFGVLLGDNIYPDGATLGADGRDDAKRFQDMFVEPYGKFGWGNPDFRIYTVLGNHDWHTSRAGAMAQVRFHETTRPFYMDGISYSAVPGRTRGEVEVFALDTHVLLAGENVLDGKLGPDGSEMPTTEVDTSEPWAAPATADEKAMVANLEARLKASTAKWKIVIGHHPLWSSSGGKFQQSRSLRAAILPVLCRYADLYFAGHEHTLELATDDCSTALPGEKVTPMPAIVTGAAGKQRPLNTAFMGHQDRNNPQYHSIYARGMVWGFAHVRLASDTATVTMVSTPNDGSGTFKLERVQAFPHRSGR
jgi:tartrate-resistant acid phosphatase type 5